MISMASMMNTAKKRIVNGKEKHASSLLNWYFMLDLVQLHFQTLHLVVDGLLGDVAEERAGHIQVCHASRSPAREPHASGSSM